MSAAGPLDGLLCHHGEDEAGHELAPSCPLQVRPHGAGAFTWPQVSGRPHSPATGTCPECGRTGVKVTKHRVRAFGPADQIVRPDKGVLLGLRPQLAGHNRPGRGAGACPAVAAVPAELTYRSVAIEAWVRDYGAEHIA